MRLLALKQRPVEKGLILIAGALAQFDGLLDWQALPNDRAEAMFATWPGPHTWIVPTTGRVPHWITGAHDGVAARVSAHPQVIALCEAFGGPLVSTSANPSGAAPPKSLDAFDARLRERIDGIVDGHTGGLERPTPIRDARSGAVPARQLNGCERRQIRGLARPHRTRKMPACVPLPRSSPCCSPGALHRRRARTTSRSIAAPTPRVA